MSNGISPEKRNDLLFKLAEYFNLTSDEYLIKLMDTVSLDYAKGYIDAFIANAGEDDIRMFYQFVRTINMV